MGGTGSGTYKQVDEDYIVERYSQWVPAWRIGREMGISRPMVLNRLRKRGVRIRKQKEYFAEKRRRGIPAKERLGVVKSQ